MAKIIPINNNDIFGDFVVKKEQDNTRQTAAKYYICQCCRCGQIKSILFMNCEKIRNVFVVMEKILLALTFIILL